VWHGASIKNPGQPVPIFRSDIRTATDEHSEVWFCAKDVCAALDISWSSMTLENMPENWLIVINLITIKDERDAYFINEAGLYHFICRSNKPKAKEFANWVCETALPEIRRTGFFETIDIKELINISKQVVSISLQVISTKNAYRRRLLQSQLRWLCNIVNQPIPPDKWIVKDYNQIDLFSDSPAKLTQ
jgi:prophage antirepressor-like protein